MGHCIALDDQNLEFVCGPLTRFLTILWKLGELLVKGNYLGCGCTISGSHAAANLDI